jgi:hypothetical protein
MGHPGIVIRVTTPMGCSGTECRETRTLRALGERETALNADSAR